MKKTAFGHVRLLSADHNGKSERGQAYFNYQLLSCRRYMNKICLAVGIFNELLLIPDLLFIASGTGRTLIVLFRTVFTALLILFSMYYSGNRGFRSFYRMTTAAELLAVALFLFVMVQYDPPDFMIQASGLYIIVLAVFLFPNRYRNMLLVSVLGISGFLFFSWRKLGRLDPNEMTASIIYFSATVLICSIFALGRNKQQYREFLTKTRLLEMSYTDQLTKASSRNRLFSEFARWQKICRRQREPLSLSLFDIDQFKSVNDRFGHTVADHVLVELAGMIRAILPDSNLLVRWGGDEFVVLLPATSLEEAVRILETVRSAVEKKCFTREIKITCSFGVAQMEENSTLDSLIHEADDRMYEGKKRGGNRVEYGEKRAQRF
ncbi:GGDEF domain-containing protein [Caproiciproducens sp. NJN-50]|uniref:GGDEF domain-containing protein n=1 Tax=Acutalibacteraceae TaxID=3082771 RepID=UPI000FFDFB02|nr:MULTISPECIES: GGDEF domain-containing protein [Acutalibacteraceae]QAT49171.1 GGDEF domain-containing protein [Caproiciproducens sp. NJN-50]